MKKMKTKTQAAKLDSKDFILQLPNHISVKIFCKIPTKKLLQFKSVCRSWLYLLSDPEFTQDLFTQTPSCFMMHSKNPSGMFIVDPEKASSPDGVSLRVPQPANADPSWMRNIIGSCNGLLCVRHTLPKLKKRINFYDFYLLNPVTGETLALPRLENVKRHQRLRAHGLGFSPITRLYKLVVILSPPAKVMVLSVGSKSWRSIGSCKDPGWRQQEMISWNGSLHWHYRYRYQYTTHLIGAFDIESEQLRVLQVPVPSAYYNQASLGGSPPPPPSIAWMMMKEYGVKESWTKAFNIPSLSRALPLRYSQGKLIMTSHDEAGKLVLMAFTPETRVLERIEGVGMPQDNVSIRLFVPNLVSIKDILLLN